MSRAVITCTWHDVPHLSEADCAEMLASYPPHQREARSLGIPRLGAGLIYPVPEADILCDPFPIPAHYRRAFGKDVGWNRTAALWGAIDPDSGILYLYSEHYLSGGEPAVHAESIKARGSWIPGVFDPGARGRAQHDGQRLIDMYNDLGIHMSPAKNAVESGIYQCWERLSEGRIRVFNTLTNFRSEYRTYARDRKGNIIKRNDHLMDAMRYLVMSGLEIATVERPAGRHAQAFRGGEYGWM